MWLEKSPFPRGMRLITFPDFKFRAVSSFIPEKMTLFLKTTGIELLFGLLLVAVDHILLPVPLTRNTTPSSLAASILFPDIAIPRIKGEPSVSNFHVMGFFLSATDTSCTFWSCTVTLISFGRYPSLSNLILKAVSGSYSPLILPFPVSSSLIKILASLGVTLMISLVYTGPSSFSSSSFLSSGFSLSIFAAMTISLINSFTSIFSISSSSCTTSSLTRVGSSKTFSTISAFSSVSDITSSFRAAISSFKSSNS